MNFFSCATIFLLAFITVGVCDGCTWDIMGLFQTEPVSQCSWYPSITRAQCRIQNKPVFIVGLFNSTLLDAVLFPLVLPSLLLVFLFHRQ